MKRVKKRWLIPMALALALIASIVLPTVLKTSADLREETFWASDVAPAGPMHDESRAVEVGVRFTSIRAGHVLGMAFFGTLAADDGRAGYLRSADGTVLAEARITGSSRGWHEARFTTPVAVSPRTEYLVTYLASDGSYAGDNDYFDESKTRGSLVLLNGVYRYAADESFRSYRNTNYYVQPIFKAGSVAPPLEGHQPSTPAATTGRPTSNGVTLRAVDGGVDYYEKFPGSLPADADYFPIGVWFESVGSRADIETDKGLGLNLYAELTNNSDLDLLQDSGMRAIVSRPDSFPERSGSILTDEADMWAGGGHDRWTGKSPGEGEICAPARGRCGFSVMETLRERAPKGELIYNNYGKGVAFTLSDADAAKFVNDYQDVVSVDAYWFTDKHICGQPEGGQLVAGGARALSTSECRLAANYGKVVERVRSLMTSPKPVWAFVEVGHPASEAEAPTITGPQIRAAVWSSIIHGARGVVYFNHSFGGDCVSFHVLRDSCGDGVRDDVKKLNLQLQRLAPVLNAPFVDGLANSDVNTDVTAKLHDGNIYLLAGSTTPERHTAGIEIACSFDGEAEVIDENRTVPVKQGKLADTFDDGNAIHLYRLELPKHCDVGN